MDTSCRRRSSSNSSIASNQSCNDTTQETRLSDVPKFPNIVRGSVVAIKFALHLATRIGNINLLTNLIKQGNSALQNDNNGRMPLHHACSHDNEAKSLQMVQIILKQIEHLDANPDSNSRTSNERMIKCLEHADNDGNIPLQIAILKGHSKVVIELMSAEKAYNKSDAIPFQWTIQKQGKPEIVKQMYENMPEVFLPFLNEAVTCKEDDRFAKELNLTVDFELITGKIEKQQRFFKSNHGETQWLIYCLNSTKHSCLLRHPVVQTFLHEKRVKIKWLLWIYFVALMLWLSLNTMLTLHFFVFLCPYKFDEFTHSLVRSSSNDTFPGVVHGVFTTISCSPGSYLPFVIFSLVFFLLSAISSAIFVTSRLWNLRNQKGKCFWYFILFEFTGNILYVVFVLTTYTQVLLQIAVGHVQICVWQYIASACAILLAWFIVIVQLFKLSTFAVYIEILWEIFFRILKIIGLYAPLLIPFAVSLKILMPENPEFQFPWVLIKVLVMMAGELNYHETFYKEDNDVKPLNLVPFPSATKAIYAMFLTVVAITFFNILLGVTLTDIKPLYEALKKDTLAKKLREINLVERILFSKIVRIVLSNNQLRRILVTCRPEKPFNTKVELTLKEIKPKLRDRISEIVIPTPCEDIVADDMMVNSERNSLSGENNNEITLILAKFQEDFTKMFNSVKEQIAKENKD